jgi:hypothetical protein
MRNFLEIRSSPGGGYEHQKLPMTKGWKAILGDSADKLPELP